MNFTTVRVAIVTVLACLAGCASAPKQAADAGDGGRAYRRMLDTALASPATADWSALRQAYAESPAYDPFVGLKPGAPNAVAAMRRGDWQSAASIAENAAAANTMDIRAQMNADIADRRLGNSAEAAIHHEIVLGLVHAIIATGNGAGPQTAFHVLGTSEEYVVLDLMHLRRGGQALLPVDGHYYDRLSATHIPDGQARTVWFNVDVSFAGEKAVISGQRHPVPQTELPQA